MIKTTSLTVQYLLRGRRVEVFAACLPSGVLAYATRIWDDLTEPLTLWSFVERAEERKALLVAFRSSLCQVDLFNEAVVNVASTSAALRLTCATEIERVEHGRLCTPELRQQAAHECEMLLKCLEEGATPQDVSRAELAEIGWRGNRATYITDRLSRSTLSICENPLGGEQEELAVWLTDWLSGSLVARSPQVKEGSRKRELCDVLFSYPHGCFLIESKALSVMSRAELPDRHKLARDTVKMIEKAVRQLCGAFRNVVAGCEITTPEGAEIVVERRYPGHAIVLLSDLSLISGVAELGGELLRGVNAEYGVLLHIVDPFELLRLTQAADELSRGTSRTTPVMALDAILVERWKKARDLRTANFHFRVRVA